MKDQDFWIVWGLGAIAGAGVAILAMSFLTG